MRVMVELVGSVILFRQPPRLDLRHILMVKRVQIIVEPTVAAVREVLGARVVQGVRRIRARVGPVPQGQGTGRAVVAVQTLLRV
jgi:hypothetical protein